MARGRPADVVRTRRDLLRLSEHYTRLAMGHTGSVCAVALWLVFSLGFKAYVEHFGTYNAAYGSIAGVIVLMLWLYLTGNRDPAGRRN